jgi:F0F1-type ATP synthase delta subunit
MKTKKVVEGRLTSIEEIPKTSEQIDTLNGLLNSIITTIQDQNKVNSALTVRVLSLEAKITLLNGRLETAKALGLGY